MKKVLITGGAGYLGKHLAKTLYNAGHKVYCIDRVRANCKYYHKELQSDIAESPKSLYQFFIEDIDTVFHLAGRIEVGMSWNYPIHFWKDNVIATLHLIDMMKEYNVPNIVYSSSAGVYKPKEIKVPETTISAKSQVGIGGPKIPQTPKNMVDPVYVDGLDTDLKKGFYEQADLDTYYKGVDTPVDIGAGKSTDLAGANIYGEGPPKPIRAIDRANIKTTGDLKVPKPEGSGYFSKVKNTYKVLGPVGVIGGKMLADESDAAYSDYLMRVDNASRANVIANETLSVVPTNTYTYAPQEFININNLDNDSNGMQRLAAGYGMILEDYNS